MYSYLKGGSVMRWTIANKVGLLIIAVLSVTLTVTFTILTTSARRQNGACIQEIMTDIEQSLLHSITFAMRQGVTDCAPYVNKLRQIDNMRDFAVLSRNSIHENSEQQMDAVERAVLSTNQPQSFREIFREEPVIRSVQPILADSSCVSCHAGSIGQSLAVVNMRYSIASIESKQNEMVYWTIFLGILSIGITSFFVVLLLRRQVGKPLTTLVSQSEEIAKGDLTSPIDYHSKDEIGALAQVFRQMKDNLKESITRIIDASAAVASATTEISAGTEEMAAGAEEQSNQAAEISASVEEMSRTIADNSRNALATAETATSAKNAATNGGKIVDNSLEVMRQIATVVQRAAETVRTLGASGNEIGEIISVINDIADQTNLLALNAAIEAARAGEQGKGFAVVADEVRKLAERTTNATKEIAEKIGRIQDETSIAVKAMQEGTKKVEEGIHETDAAGSALNEIVTYSNKVTEMIAAIASASDQQAATSEQIATSIEGISNVTRETATGLQQIAHSYQDLNRLTLDLESLTQQFTIGRKSVPPMSMNASQKALPSGNQLSGLQTLAAAPVETSPGIRKTNGANHGPKMERNVPGRRYGRNGNRSPDKP